MNPNRIEFIDLAKGICIILVVIGHCGVNVNIPGFEVVRMPFYFILSGLFFKDYGAFLNFLIKKTNKILIPFSFFYLIGYACYYAINILRPNLLITDSSGILDILYNRQYFNGPIWFLLALYWCNVYFYLITLFIKKDVWRVAIVSGLGILGYSLGEENLFSPFFFDVALTALPFFCFGYYLKKTPILFENKYDQWNWLFVIVLYLISLLISCSFTFRMAFHYNGIGGGLSGYILAITSVLAIMLLCKIIKHIPVISKLGKYSLIILCTHHMIYRPLKLILREFSYSFFQSPLLLAALTLAISYLLIPICIKLIPYFVAQKDLIKTHEAK